VEFKDSLKKTVIKEAKEETGLVVEPINCISIIEDNIDSQHWISFGFSAKLISGNLKNNEPYKFDEVKYFDIDNLPDNVAKLTKRVILDYKKNNVFEINEVNE